MYESKRDVLSCPAAADSGGGLAELEPGSAPGGSVGDDIAGGGADAGGSGGGGARGAVCGVPVSRGVGARRLGTTGDATGGATSGATGDATGDDAGGDATGDATGDDSGELAVLHRRGALRRGSRDPTRESSPRKRKPAAFVRCGGCDGCAKFREGVRVGAGSGWSNDCGECVHCGDMPKFGGKKNKSSLRTCYARQCEKHPDLLKKARNLLANQMWAECYMAERDKWQHDCGERRVADRTARELRTARRAPLRAARLNARREARQEAPPRSNPHPSPSPNLKPEPNPKPNPNPNPSPSPNPNPNQVLSRAT